jgi:hypothetical protein
MKPVWERKPTRRELIKRMKRDARIFGWDFVRAYLAGMKRAGCTPFLPPSKG